MKKTLVLGVISAFLGGCGGGGSESPAPVDRATLTLSGTAATGMAIDNASVIVKCQVGTGTTTTASDGSYSMQISGAASPCILELVNPVDKTKLHSIGVVTGSAATINITPLTELVVARILLKDPSAVFGSIDQKSLGTIASDSSIANSQGEVSSVLAEAIGANGLKNFIYTPFKAATQADRGAGDDLDRGLDQFKARLTAQQIQQITDALMSGKGASEVAGKVSDFLQPAPVATAGAGQNVVAGDVVTLDGTGSSDAKGNPLSFSWSLVSKPEDSAATLSPTNAAKPTFIADSVGTYVVSLVVNNGKKESSAATIVVEAFRRNAPPVANAGSGQNVAAGTLINLDGSGSSDANGDPLSYAWSMDSRPMSSRAVLSSTTAVKPTFIPDLPGDYVFSLIVNDGKASSQPVSVKLTVSAAPNLPPLEVLTITGDSANKSTGFGAATYLRSQIKFDSFWDFCPLPDLNGCGFNLGDDVVSDMRVLGSGDLYNAELNVNLSAAYPVDLYTQSFNAKPDGTPPTEIVQTRVNAGKISNTPSGKSIGFLFGHTILDYALPPSFGRAESVTYTFAATNNADAITDGWKAATRTKITVTLSSSWTDSEGRPAFATLPIFSKTYEGSFSDVVVLSKRLEDFPALQGSVGTYSIQVIQQKTFTRK